ncbi:MAG: UDP-N-acetylmuramoyl-tripeptide--D-alanyl-D-alanine ligase [Candidatus Omnitrophica bacterium]|nr:UDP-N-acetylmuramoyl-tripeptide--D-alanyl-D-alanine ligase [Candidatus Omnitrophota bacterium]
MTNLNIEEILKTRTFSGISTDTRTIKEGELFIALRGENFDGHDFVEKAATKKAAGAIIDSKIQGLKGLKSKKFILIQAKDTLSAFGDIAHFYRMRFKIPLIGITGSSGKTTAKEMIYEVLSSKFKVLKNKGTENNSIGLSHTLLRLHPGHSIGVMELGTNHFGEIRRLSQVLKPTVGIITNIGPAHLEFLKSEAGVLKEKMELLKSLDKDGLAIINADDALLKDIKGLKCKIVKFGMDKNCDFKVTKIFQEKEAIWFTVNGNHDFKIRLLGKQNVYNALIAITVGFLHGVDFNSIHNALSEFKPLNGRLCLRSLGPIKVIDDTYNSNPQSVKAALAVLASYKSAGRKILICADMLELGSLADKFHAETGRAISKANPDYLISVGNFSKTINEAAIFGGMNKDAVISCKDNLDVLKTLKAIVSEGDVLLLKGSRRMKLNEVADALSSSISTQGDMVRV